MYLEEIVLDGFKSYANRTVISDFDPQFNAITGLNGSGKSNILDAICFVLGITNLSQVRVRSLQELVYKQGQAGVTKASVTLVFNNKDSNSSPVGYEQYDTISITRQVVIGGRNKYLINGHSAQVSQVQNLFHSVQLNVNNPHFLIMQGRITKVLNMKPPEILGMVEEAAGTRMFEDKKEGAKNVIAKKQGKVDEINKLLSQEITPTLDTLRRQRTAYIQWTNNSTEIERLSRFKVAYDYTIQKDIVEKGEENIQELKNQQEDMMETIDNLKVEQTGLKKQLTELNGTRNDQFDKVLLSLQTEETQKSKDLVKKNGEYQNEDQALQREKNTLEDLNQQNKELTTNIDELQQQINLLTDTIHTSEEEYEKSKTLLSEFENALISIENGDITTEDDGNINERITENTRALNTCQSVIAQTNQKLSLSKELLDSLQNKLQICGNDNKQNTKDSETFTANIKKYEKLLDSLHFDNNKYNELQTLMNKKEMELQSISDEIDSLEAPISAYLKFEYTTPNSREFHKEGVKGIVANLIKVNDDKYVTALETVAGGKLFQVIVDTEETGKLILNEGRLRRRYTFIPLNRIKARTIPPHKVSLAQKIGGNDVNTAISFIASDEELQPALQYVFGNSFICKDLETAKKVTFNEGINTRSVTLDGDSFDPSGTLEGGSREKEMNTLSMLYKINALKDKKECLQQEYSKIKKEYESMNYKKQTYTEYNSTLEIEKHNLKLLSDRMEHSEYSVIQGQVEKCKQEISQYENIIKENKTQQKDISAKIKELEKKQKEYTSSKGDHLKQINKKIDSTKKDIKKKEKLVNDQKLKLQETQIEISQLQSEFSILSSKIVTSQSQVDALTITSNKLLAEVSYMKEAYQHAQEAVKGKKTEVEVLDIQIKQISKEEEQKEKKVLELESILHKLETKQQKIEKDRVDSKKILARLLNDHPWIEQEEQYFGNENTDYAFNQTNPQEIIERLTQLKSEQDKLGRSINKKVMTMLEKAEGEYQDLLKKKRIIEKDKAQIQHVIEELETKKNEALQKTYTKVNKDFGEIFATLLPGASARLEPPEGQSVTEGLEVRVAFSGKDKESLSELSGGQRSLLALSLVLALLLFKPAPMYILDEVDAALDLSHTQNIGRMLRKHFGQSQFIIVSLKEGMFNNANVIFRTKFVDGVSTVTRTLGRNTNIDRNANANTHNQNIDIDEDELLAKRRH